MQLVLNITDKKKANLLMEFLKELKYVNSVRQVEDKHDVEIPEWQQKIVLDRIKNSKPEDYVAWKDFKKVLKKKYGF